MNELDEIRKKKLEAMISQQQSNLQDELQVQQELQQLELVVKQQMTKDALQRFGNIKAADPQKAVQLLVVLGQLLQAGRIKQIDDEKLKQILTQLTPKKKGFRIRRK